MTARRTARELGPASTARQIIDASRYLTLATADSAGHPWASPVWYAHEGYASFFWVSRPAARHSRNLAARPTASIVIFDSTVPELRAQAVYLQATAEELSGAECDDAIAIFSRRSLALGLREWRTADVVAPAPHRLYRARASDYYILGPNNERLPVKIGGSEPAEQVPVLNQQGEISCRQISQTLTPLRLRWRFWWASGPSRST